MNLYYLKIALRNLLKNKLYSFLILGGFSIGFASSILIGLYYFTEKNVNKDFANYRQIYRLYNAKDNNVALDYNLYPLLVKDYPEVENACPMEFLTGIEFTLKNDQNLANIRIKNILSTTNSFFSMFSVKVVQSVSDSPFSETEAIVLTESVAKVLFGKQSALGQKVKLNNYYSATVTAIIKDLPANSSFKADVIVNTDNENFRFSKTCYSNQCFTLTNLFVQVKEDTNIADFTKKLKSTIGNYHMKVDSVALQNLADIYFSTIIVRDLHFKGNTKLIRVFLAIALLIILLSSINYFNYTISLQFAKLKEIGIKKVNGAGWGQLTASSFTEVTLSVIFAVIISFFIVLLLLPFTETLFGKTLTFDSIRIR